jgi:hypothetical protein
LRESGFDDATGGFDVRFVTIGTQEKAREFCGKQAMAARCIGDESKASYAAMGLGAFNLLKLFTDPALKKRRKENSAAGFSQDWGATKLGDGAQLPGAAIVDGAGKIRWFYRGVHPGDLPPMAEMLDRAKAILKT